MRYYWQHSSRKSSNHSNSLDMCLQNTRAAKANPILPGAQSGTARIPSKWRPVGSPKEVGRGQRLALRKRCYIYAELDSKRQHIAEAEAGEALVRDTWQTLAEVQSFGGGALPLAAGLPRPAIFHGP